MYGIIFIGIGEGIQADHGKEIWLTLLDKVGYKNIVFCTHSTYPDDLIMDLAKAGVEFFDDCSTVEDSVAYFGRCFTRSSKNFGYGAMIRRCGRTFSKFLACVDNLHLHMRYSYNKMILPFISVLEEYTDGALILYKTRRSGFCPFLFGILEEVARTVHGIQLTTSLPDKPHEQNNEFSMYRIRLYFDNQSHLANKAHFVRREQKINYETQLQLPDLPGDILMKLFPFCIAFRPDMKIFKVGVKWEQLFPYPKMVGKKLPEVAHLRRPKINLTWQNMVTLPRALCELEVVLIHMSQQPQIDMKRNNNWLETSIDEERLHPKLILHGHMRYIEDWGGIVYLCNPLINSVEDLCGFGLKLSDLSMHGNGRDMVMTGRQHTSRLEDLYEKTEQRAKQLEVIFELRDRWKQRGDDLLYSMIPQSIAEKLRNGLEPVDTCEHFDSITVSFVEMTNVEDIMATSVFEAVNCMNAVFSGLDKVIDEHNVYKVETVGATYMVIGGAPEKNETHVKDVSIVALGFQDEVQHKPLPSGFTIEIRIGIHSGPAVAGVLGRKTPRYCFFGDTINTAARMQTTSLPTKIQISSATHKLLQTFPGFICERRGIVWVKGKGEMETYWLLKYEL